MPNIGDIEIPGIDFPSGGGNKFSPKEILDWKLASRKYLRNIAGEAISDAAKAVPSKAGSAALNFAKGLGGYLTRVGGAVLSADGLANDGEYWLKARLRLADEKLKNATRPIVQYNPVVYEPGSTIFVEGQTRYVYVPIPPARRLKALAAKPDNSPIRTSPIPSVTVEQGFKSRVWGEILHEPIAPAKMTVTRFDTRDFYKKLDSESRKSEKKLSQWLVNGAESSIKDQSLVFINWFDFGDTNVELDVLCGLSQIQTFYDGLLLQSKNAIRPVMSMAPQEVDFKTVKLKPPKYDDIKIPYENTRGGQAIKTSGADAYPVIVPKDITGSGNDKTMIKSTAELGVYLIKMIDQLVGAFPIEIKIKDNDLTKDGNQEFKMIIPNLSEGIAEILGGTINTQLYEQAILNIVFKNLVQTCKNTVGISVTQDISRATADYIGFEAEESTAETVFPFNPEASTIQDALKNTTQKYETFRITDKRDLNDYLVEFMQAAAIIKGANFKKVPTVGIKDTLKKYLESLKDENKDFDDDNWIEFLNQVEAGFSNEGVTEKQNPYNRTFQERPRIRDVGEVG